MKGVFYALRNEAHHAEQLFDKLHPLEQLVIGSILATTLAGGIYLFSTNECENQRNHTSSHFILSPYLGE